MMLSAASVGLRSAANGSSSCTLCSGFGTLGSITMMPMNPMVMSAAVPKNGPRHEISPSRPPSSGPTARPSPSAAS